MALVEIKDVTKRYGAFEVLKGLSLDVERHQVVCLIGPSGCGKSTLLRCINGLEPIQGGEIRLHDDRVSGPGVDLDALRRDVGIVIGGIMNSGILADPKPALAEVLWSIVPPIPRAGSGTAVPATEY